MLTAGAAGCKVGAVENGVFVKEDCMIAESGALTFCTTISVLEESAEEFCDDISDVEEPIGKTYSYCVDSEPSMKDVSLSEKVAVSVSDGRAAIASLVRFSAEFLLTGG